MELFIRVVDKIVSDPMQSARLTHRGDVIVVMPDGHDWTPSERTHQDYRILRIAAVKAEAEAMLAAEPGDEKNRMLQRRAFKLNLDDPNLPAAVKEFIADGSRRVPIGTVTVTQMRAIKQQKQPIADPGLLP